MFSDSNMFHKIYKTLAVMSNAFHFINLQSEAELGVPEELVSHNLFGHSDFSLLCHGGNSSLE